jgi:hypothetical protein
MRLEWRSRIVHDLMIDHSISISILQVNSPFRSPIESQSPRDEIERDLPSNPSNDQRMIPTDKTCPLGIFAERSFERKDSDVSSTLRLQLNIEWSNLGFDVEELLSSRFSRLVDRRPTMEKFFEKSSVIPLI